MFGIFPDAVYTSLLHRSIKSYNEIAKPEHGNIQNVPVIRSWRLNERHYGALMGLGKEEAELTMGKQKVKGWRRSWDLAPPRMLSEDEYYWQDAPWARPMTIYTDPGKHTVVTVEKGVPMPLTESLKDCAQRVQPIWERSIAPKVARGETVLVVAHANSIRSMIKHIDSATITDEAVRDIHIPPATPLVYNFTLTTTKKVTSRMTNDEIVQSLKPIGEPSRLGMTGRYLASKEIARLALKAAVPAEDEYNNSNLKDKKIDSGDEDFFELIDKPLQEIIAFSEKSFLGRREALIVFDEHGVILHANTNWQKLFEFDGSELEGKTAQLFEGPLTNEKEVSKIKEQLRTGLPVKTMVINYSKNGKAHNNHMTIIPVYDWIQDSQILLKEEEDASNANSQGRFSSASFLDYGGEKKQFSKFIRPSYFVAKVDTHEEVLSSDISKESE
jgi:2,3-bisphosphoglycerate-dependent phosphoglycerate mutase